MFIEVMIMKKHIRIGALLLAIIMTLTLFTSCAKKPVVEDPVLDGEALDDIDIEMTYVPLAEGVPATQTGTVARGIAVSSNAKAVIDYSDTADGYIMVCYLGTNPTIKVLVTGPSKVQYTYNLAADGAYDVLPLSDGNGEYKIGVYENVSGTKYTTALSATITVTLKDEFAPFLHSNQYVDYDASKEVKALAEKVTKDKTTEIAKIEAVYTYVVKNFTYDYDLAKSVKSGYLPVIDTVISKKKGICFDYAALMTAMLRLSGVPCKLVIGYTGKAYHAWINTYSKDGGWMDAKIYFDGSKWKLMDPTFASSSKSSDAILKYIGDGANYTAKYIY